MNEYEKKAIEVLDNIEYTDICSDEFYDARDTVLNIIYKQQKEIEERETRLQEEINENCKLKTELYGNSISKDKIREYFAHDIAFKRRLIKENEEISDYNRGKFDTIEDLLERLEDNKWN